MPPWIISTRSGLSYGRRCSPLGSNLVPLTRDNLQLSRAKCPGLLSSPLQGVARQCSFDAAIYVFLYRHRAHHVPPPAFVVQFATRGMHPSSRRSSMKVKDAMHKGVDWVSPETPVTELAKLMREHDIGAIPIGENDRLIGMVTDRDIVCKGLAQDSFDVCLARARDVMTPGIQCCQHD